MDPTNGEDPLLLPPQRSLLDQTGFEGFGGTEGGVRGSIAERRATKCGFRAEMINPPSFSSQNPHGLVSPLVTIPAGISPTALLESPIMLPNSMPSPTTGSYRYPLYDSVYESPPAMKTENDIGLFHDGGGFPEFPLFFNRTEESDLPPMISVGTMGMGEFEFPKLMLEDDAITVTKYFDSNMGRVNYPYYQSRHLETSAHPQGQPLNGASSDEMLPSEEQEAIPYSAADLARVSDDGYNWRKYGQKQVKGSEFPRSYYKCTQQTCQVKKKIERSHHGQITEIIYKGEHNHPKPQPSRKTPSFLADTQDGGVGHTLNGASVQRIDGIDKTSQISGVTDHSDPLPATHGRAVGGFDPSETPELSSAFDNEEDDDDENDDDGTEAYRSNGADDEESEFKKRRLDDGLIDNFKHRSVREPRVVVQIESEVDILDDGYRWRKYGQKVVKGNPNPRSYYKCTTSGCGVRKHVERSSNNLKFVITTYEGKHNHEVPAPRNSTTASTTHASSGGGNALPTSRQASAQTSAQHVSGLPSFDRKSVLNEYARRSTLPRGLNREFNPGAYAMRVPSIFSNPMQYGAFECSARHMPVHQLGSMASLIPPFPLRTASSLGRLQNLPHPNLEFNRNITHMRSASQFQPGQPLIIPKQEYNDSIYDAGSSFTDPSNSSSSAGTSPMY